MDEDARFVKIDDAIQRLAAVASDLSRILAVHEQRIMQQERNVDTLNTNLERRRDAVDEKFENVYSTIKNETEKVTAQITAARDAAKKQHEDQDKKILSLQKYIWMGMGGCGVIMFLINFIVTHTFK